MSELENILAQFEAKIRDGVAQHTATATQLSALQAAHADTMNQVKAAQDRLGGLHAELEEAERTAAKIIADANAQAAKIKGDADAYAVQRTREAEAAAKATQAATDGLVSDARVEMHNLKEKTTKELNDLQTRRNELTAAIDRIKTQARILVGAA